MTRLIHALGVVALSFASSALAQSATTKPTTTAALTSGPAATVPPAATTVASETLVSLHSSNPTAVPLSSIWSGASGQPTVALVSTYAAGATPPVSGAPPLPSWAFSPTLGFPPLDATPPTNSTLVQGWIQDVKNSGIAIPGLELSVTGGCAANPTLVSNTSRCWWTCGGCTRETDVTTCPDKMTWGLSYDDGPSPYSSDLVNYLATQKLTSTFFIVGSRAISRPDILQAEYMGGHQLSVHTWSHPYMTTLTTEQVIAELGWTKKAIKDITGVTPNTWRPPYGDVDDRVRAIAQAMGLTTVIWSSNNGIDYDTEDWHIPSGVPTDQVIDTFDTILKGALNLTTGFIVLEHDLYQQTVDLAIGYVLPDALARQPPFTLKSIITCLNKPLEDAYIETNNNSTNPVGHGATTLSIGATGALSSASTRGAATSTGTQSAGSGQGSNGAAARLGGAGAAAGALVGVVGLVLGSLAVAL